MKRLLTILAAVALICAPADTQEGKNQEIARMIHENIERAGINTDPYEFLPTPETKAPKGYKPFYISHYGRHGARSDWAGFLYCPFACNLQMIFFKNAKDDVLVKFYLNERETNLITLEGGPYYKWEDVKKAIKTAPGIEYAI